MNRLLLLSFLLLSCQSTETKESPNSENYCSSINRAADISVAKTIQSFDGLTKNKTGVYVLEDGAGSMVSRAWLSEYAEETIDIQYFIFSTDNVGLIACDYLIRAADRGVKVRIIVDDIMVDADIQDVLMMDSHENIEIKIYNPGVNLGKNILSKIKTFSTDFRNANQRMHNKTFNVDNKAVITGGRNIANEYFDYSRDYNFRDRDVLLFGKVVEEVHSSFETFWVDSICVDIDKIADPTTDYANDPDRFNNLYQYACNPENFSPVIRKKVMDFPAALQSIYNSGDLQWVDSVEFVSDLPGKNDGNEGLSGGGITTSSLMDLVNKAESSIDIQSPYLITTQISRDLFTAATKRGVKIRILTNSLPSTDNLEAFSGYQRDREKLLATGVRIFEFKPDAAIRKEIMTSNITDDEDFNPIFGLHAKSMVIDGKITVVGTFNLDPRSANLNTECITIIHSESISVKVAEGMEVEFQPENSWETTIDYNPDKEGGVKKRIKTWTRKIVPKGIL